MLFEKTPPLDILTCATCQGAGHIGMRACRACNGKGSVRMARKYLLYWGVPMTRYHIRLRKSRRKLHIIESISAVLVGLLCFGIFGWLVYRSDDILNVFTTFYWRTTGSNAQVFFWLAIMAFSFVIYRRISLKKDPVHVESYEETPTDIAEAALNKLGSWEDAKKIGRSKRIDIAEVFTEEAHMTMEAVFQAADNNGSTRLTPEHMFYGLLTVQSVRNLFVRLGIPVKKLQEIILQGFQGKRGQTEPVFSEEFIQILFHSYELAYEDKQDFVHVTELLISTVAHSEHLQELLYDLEIDKQKLANVVEWLRIRERLRRQHQELQRAAMHRSKYGLDRAMTAVATPYLNRFSQDITMSAKYGRLAPCVARDTEIDEIFRVIEGGRQSVLLVGDRGAGKMSIIEGIAQLMVEDRVPDRLKDKRLVQLSTSALLAGTTVSGAQERLINMMSEIAKAGNVILFIRNIHDLAGAGSTGGGAGLDVTETLAEYLGSGQFLSFATTTTQGFNQHIVNTEVGSVLGRIDVDIMDENQAIQVLESKAGHLEYKHRIFFSYNAFEQAVKLSDKYLHDQNLPESAIGVVTEAASLARGKRGENSLVSAEDVAQVVSSKTGIPATSISEEESQKLLRLEDEMHKRVVGQDEAVKLVANALRRARAEIRSQKRPIANFLFLGPTGVGKTELAKTIASVYFGGEERMIRIDMSEYQDKSGVYRLIGQPGQQGTGILTEAVRQNPFSLVLLDEMEKADPDILNLFLQVFDDGRLTDSVGRVIDFTNSIIIATSNAGTSYVQQQIQSGVPLEQIRQEIIRGELKKYYRPEFLNRFDGIVLFKALERAEIKHIAKLMLVRVAKDLEQRGIFLRTEDVALEALADAGFDPEFGARPMRRAIQDLVENRLAELVLQNQLNRRDTVVLGKGLEMRVERG